jgi:RNA polymerase sigma-70 factor (ECF subfamily)
MAHKQRVPQASGSQASGPVSKQADEQDPAILLARSQAGDHEAYRQFLEWAAVFTRKIVKKRLMSWNMNTAELVDDFVQEILLSVHQKRHTHLASLPVEPWLSAIIKYKSIDWLRRVISENRRITFSDSSVNPDIINAADPGAEAAFDVGSTSQELSVALESLTEQQREVLELAKIQGLSIDEVAERTGLSPANVKVTIHRTLKLLRRKFGGTDL